MRIDVVHLRHLTLNSVACQGHIVMLCHDPMASHLDDSAKIIEFRATSSSKRFMYPHWPTRMSTLI